MIQVLKGTQDSQFVNYSTSTKQDSSKTQPSVDKFSRTNVRCCGSHHAMVKLVMWPELGIQSNPTVSSHVRPTTSHKKSSLNSPNTVKKIHQEDTSYSLFSISLQQSTSEPYSIKLNINNTEILMEFDTGASLSEKVFNQLEIKAELDKSLVTLNPYRTVITIS